jgi:MoaA/NifB/PqqE/SkfB family radical SAM enzyme/SAM-dependent methyltransferase
MSKTACIIPWSNLILGPDGRASFCCDVPEPLTIDGRVGSIYRDSLDELWNAPDIVQVRAAMARGERPATCRVCWEREAAGGASRRLLVNGAYRHFGGQLPIETLAREGAATGYRLDRRPDWFVLELGNVCNLKCRSCGPLFSSRIAADAVQAAWVSGEPPPAAGSAPEPPPRRRLQVVPENAAAWFQDVEGMAGMIASGAGAGNAMLTLLGGEPFLIAHTWRLLRALAARGVAQQLCVTLLTNGQQRSDDLLELAPQFRAWQVAVSIDGHGKLYEYLRHGARWQTLIETLRWLRQVPKVELSAVPTLQNGNALDMVRLLRFLDQEELPLAYNVVTWPARLRPANLPPSVRRIAARRLRGYLDTECRPANLGMVRAYCEVLEAAGDEFDPGLFAEFMTFTNDLDAARGESLREAAPELPALLRAAGIEWSNERRHGAPSGAAAARTAPPWPADLVQRVNRTISPRDALFGGFESSQAGAYFSSAASQLAAIDALLRQHGHPGLAGSRAVADFACHYGRLTRALRAALPHAAVYACDIDRGAVQFCAAELGAVPVVTGWLHDESWLPCGLDAVICVSLLTHTPLEHWRRALRAWARMLRPGGCAAFTFLSEKHLEAWMAGAMEHYGSYSREQRDATVRGVREEGWGFAALPNAYGGEPLYGIAFVKSDIVRRELAAAGLEVLVLAAEVDPVFSQDLALVRKPDKQTLPQAAEPAVRRDLFVVAIYEPRCYAPAPAGRGSSSASVWARLVEALPPRSLPTELGFCDPRVPEVREAQAALAREHGIDAFCYLYRWGAGGPLWDAPWRDLLATGRPDHPCCLMLVVEDGELLAAAAAKRLFDEIAPGLADRRYLRVDGRPLLVVRDVSRLVEPRAIAAAWRAAAAARGLGELHLCAAEPIPAGRPEDLGFDSVFEAPPPAADLAEAVAAALVRPWPAHRLFRTVECRRDAAAPRAGELYEHWLRSAVDTTRRRGASLVFVDAWNDWLRAAYLEPDDGDGRAALLATRRATRGPASGMVLLRQLRDALGEVEGPAATLLGELGQVVALHEHTRDRLLWSVEAALGRDQADAAPEVLHWVPVASRHLPPSDGRFCLDRVGSAGTEELQGSREPIPLRGDQVHLAGWAHLASCPPGEVHLFLALESATGAGDRIVRVIERVARLDVTAALPGHPKNCGFDTVVDLAGLPAGTYGIAIVQRTPDATYRDATGVAVRRDAAPCSSA